MIRLDYCVQGHSDGAKLDSVFLRSLDGMFLSSVLSLPADIFAIKLGMWVSYNYY